MLISDELRSKYRNICWDAEARAAIDRLTVTWSTEEHQFSLGGRVLCMTFIFEDGSQLSTFDIDEAETEGGSRVNF